MFLSCKYTVWQYSILYDANHMAYNVQGKITNYNMP